MGYQSNSGHCKELKDTIPDDYNNTSTVSDD